MLLKIDQKDLMSLIGKTQNIVERRNLMPVLVNVLIEAQDGRLKIYATDLEVSMTDSKPAQVLEPGRLAVGAKSLFEIVRELSAGSTVELHRKENNWLEIRQGKYESKIVGVSPQEYPIFPEVSLEGAPKIPGDVLRDMIEKTIYSTSTDETRYHLNGVYFEESGADGYAMVGTDGHRLSIIKRPLNQLGTLMPAGQGVIIPKKGLIEIRKMVEASSADFEIFVEGTQLVLKQDEALLMIRLVEARYPNYLQFLPKDPPAPISVSREKFLSSIKRVSLLANQKSKAVMLNLSNGKMEISSNNPEIGDAKEELEIEYTGDDISVGFNAKYMQEALSALPGSNVELQVRDQMSPGLLRSADDKDYLCIVMPMRF